MYRLFIIFVLAIFSYSCGPTNTCSESKEKCKKIVKMYEDFHLQRGCIRGCAEMLKVMSPAAKKLGIKNKEELFHAIKVCQINCMKRLKTDSRNPAP